MCGDSLLAFSRMGRAQMRTGRVDLNALVAESRQALAAELEGRQVDWRVAALPAVEGDAALLGQVWANLVSNAVKYTARARAPASRSGSWRATTASRAR